MHVKRLLLIAAIVVLTALPAAAAGPYFSLSPNVWLPHRTFSSDYSLHPASTDYSPGVGIAGAFGVMTARGLRIEYEISYREAQAKHGVEDTWAAASMMNMWQHLPISNSLSAYAGGGIGFARSHVASSGFVDQTGPGFGYQAGFGVDFRLSRRMSMDIGYRYFGVADTAAHSIGPVDQTGSSVLAGLRFGL